MTGQHPCGWTDTWALRDVAGCLKDRGGCPYLGSGFSVNSWCDLGRGGRFLHGWVLLWWQRTFWSMHWLRCLSQLGPVWLSKESQWLGALCDRGDSDNLQEAAFGQSYVAGDSWAEQGGLRSVFVLLQSQRRVQCAHSRIVSKISWCRNHLYKMLCGAQQNGAPVSDGAVDPGLIWVITAWTVSSLGSVNQCWTEMLSPFHWLAVLSQDWEDSKGSSQWNLISDHRTSAVLSPIPWKIT